LEANDKRLWISLFERKRCEAQDERADHKNIGSPQSFRVIKQSKRIQNQRNGTNSCWPLNKVK